MPPEKWKQTFRIRSYDIDPTGVVSVRSICNYLQEAAGGHAQALGVSVEQLFAREMTWFLGRLHISMEAYPGWGTDLQIETWPSGIEGLFATREFLLTDGGGSNIGRATSAWLVIDLKKRRPVRVPDEIADLRQWKTERVLPEESRLPSPDNPEHEEHFVVRYGDLDINRHLNNTHYPDWAVGALPRSYVESRHLTSIETHFRVEAVLGDTVVSEAQELAENEYVHRLRRERDGRDLAAARTRWE